MTDLFMADLTQRPDDAVDVTLALRYLLQAHKCRSLLLGDVRRRLRALVLAFSRHAPRKTTTCSWLRTRLDRDREANNSEDFFFREAVMVASLRGLGLRIMMEESQGMASRYIASDRPYTLVLQLDKLF